MGKTQQLLGLRRRKCCTNFRKTLSYGDFDEVKSQDCMALLLGLRWPSRPPRPRQPCATPRASNPSQDHRTGIPSRGRRAVCPCCVWHAQAAYEAAHAQSDLSMGDAHLVDCGGAAPGLHVALLVVLSRDRKAPPGTPPALCSRSLDAALGRLASAAATMGGGRGECRNHPTADKSRFKSSGTSGT